MWSVIETCWRACFSCSCTPMKTSRRRSSTTMQRRPGGGRIEATTRSLLRQVLEGIFDLQVAPAIDRDDLAGDRRGSGKQRYRAADLAERGADAERRAAVHLPELLLG